MDPKTTEGITLTRDEAVVILGAGRLGLHLAAHLRFAGMHDLCVWNRSPLDETRSALLNLEIQGSPPPRAYISHALPESEIRAARTILLTVADDALVPLAHRLAQEAPPASDCPVLHCSGALPGQILLPLETLECPVGSLHPLQTFSGIPARHGLNGTFFAIEGHPRALAAAQALVSHLGGKAILLTPEGKVHYHTAAVMASNLLVALVSLAVEVMDQATGDSSGSTDSLELLLPLIQGTLTNLGKNGLPSALTGPISRGDINVVARHLEALAKKTHPDGPGQQGIAPRVYQLLSLQAVTLAKQQGISKDKCEALARLLSPQGP